MRSKGWNEVLMVAVALGISVPAFAGEPSKGKVVVSDGKNKVVIGADADDDTDDQDVVVGDDGVQAGNVKVTGAGVQGATTQTGAAEGKTLALSGNAKKFDHTCKADGTQIVVISGNSNNVTLTGECESVTVSGNAQKVTIEAAGTITISGNANKVTYLRGKGSEKAPKIVQSGNANKVSLRKP